jgi:kynurenine 3-monooxygenase
MTTSTAETKVTIIGAGLGGSLMAIYLARRGFKVEVYERRGDMRFEPVARGRSINMTLAARGLRALEEVGLLDTVMQMTIPLRGRLVHSPEGAVAYQPYGKNDAEVIHAVMRNELNMALMNKAHEFPNVKFLFHKRCVRLDKDNAVAHMLDEKTNEAAVIKSDIVIGADGVFSTIRQQIQRGERASYQQDFLDWGYKELTIPPTPGGSYQMDSRGLHIWPRGDSMLMAMPNYDGSLTCTCILPFEGELSFETLNTPDAVMSFFKARFSDAVPVMPTLIEDFLRNPVVEMITTRTSPWRYKDKVVLVGDSCHAVVPFYGQGMNAAFEDCLVLNECIDEFPNEWGKVFAAYQSKRKPNTDVLADLSKRNFIELRNKVRSPVFIARKKVDVLMNKFFPGLWLPLYTMITHMTVPIAEASERYRRQNRIAKWLGLDVLLMMVALFVVLRDYYGRVCAREKRTVPLPQTVKAPALSPDFQPIRMAELPMPRERASAATAVSDQ